MQITSIKIQNYKVLRNIEIKNLSHLSVFLGANGSGKTTFFDVFGFMSHALKENIKNPLLIRIACKELESWYLGDFNALKTAYPECERNKIFFQRNRNPDILQASDEIRKIIPTFQNIQGAKDIAPHMEVIKTEQNNSHSFRIFIKGITNFFIQNTTI